MVLVTGSLLEAQCTPRCLVPFHPLGVLLASCHSLGHSARPPLTTLCYPDFWTPSYSHSEISCLLLPSGHSMSTWFGTTMITPRPPGYLTAPFLLTCRMHIPHILATLLTVRRNFGHRLLDAELLSSQECTEKSEIRLASRDSGTQWRRVARRVCVA